MSESFLLLFFKKEDLSSLTPPRHAAAILLVEDDETLAGEVAMVLREAGHAVTSLSDGAEAVAAATSGSFDLLVVDRMLPGLDGLSLLERVRDGQLSTPVLVISALGAVDERVRGLKAGGDDYLTKPFALVELAARVEALLRRPLETRQSVLSHGPLTMDLITRTVTRDGVPIDLLPREFKLLEYFLRRPGQLITRAMLLEEVWNYRFVPQTNLIDVHIGKLRRKIDAGAETSLIESVRGAGFVLG
jgi:two-component system OmpR family response regulator